MPDELTDQLRAALDHMAEQDRLRERVQLELWIGADMSQNYPPPNQRPTPPPPPPPRPGVAGPPSARHLTAQDAARAYGEPRLIGPPARPHGAGHVLGKIAKYSALSFAWVVQYLFWVPLVIFGRLCVGAMKLGLLGFFLLCIPIIGWAIIAVKVFSGPSPRRPGPSIWKPWGTR